MKTYMVGGAVRDMLLGWPVQDRDWVVVGATPQELIGAGYTPVGKDFPVFLHPQTHEEVALARTERKTAPGYHGFSFHADPTVTLEEDLARRDLTINAIAQDEQGHLIDPYGGQKDLHDKVLRHVTQAFAEDPVRILRVARFAARYVDFTVAPETMQLMRAMVVAGEVDALVAERVWQELSRGLMEKMPSRMIRVLHECGALARILPEIDQRFGAWQLILSALQPSATAQDAAAHADGEIRYDRRHGWAEQGRHTLRVLDLSAQQGTPLPVRFTCLVYDAALTDALRLETQLEPDRDLLQDLKGLCERLRVPVECRELAQLAQQFVAQIHGAAHFDAGAVMRLFKHADAFRQPDRFRSLLDVAQVDATAYPEWLGIRYPQRQWLGNALDAALAVDTKDVARQAMASGAQGLAVGEAVDAARLACIEKNWQPLAQ
ncbi:multifunctional CCA tRNA nucleotidyl transferase/2'3'-cyclic phosphodiesterase/2'nucleotidase/phosphatase [Saezia sanguinis]|uniref:multifunctional CCA tRNA nucleotidyl transferase/2'3'-cyclic phosphodiesterase/2'nucleotidase/phosphatase n=1 Tax=Saezia sanguinis TaxID=1965230 RepID=UPI0030423A8F